MLTTGSDAPRITLRSDGLEGTRNYRVNTHRESVALTAAGVPDIGSAWDEGFPSLICRSVTAQHEGGMDDPGGTGGWSRISTEYASFSGNLSKIPRSANLAYTEIISSSSSVNVIAPVIRNASYTGPPLGNGAGVPVERSQLIVRIHRWRPAAMQLPINALVGIANTYNLNSVTTPPIFGSAQTLTFEPGQLFYRGFTPNPGGELIELVHELVASADHRYSEQDTDDRGFLLGEPRGPWFLSRQINWPAL